MSVEVGQPAPDFALKDQNNEVVRLSDFKGKKNVVLLFHPLAFAAPCTTEFCSLRDDLSSFENDDVQLLTVSVDSVFAKKAWGKQEGYEFPMLSDLWPHGATAQAYGVFNEEKGLALRATFVIDREGIVRWKVVNDIPDIRDQAEYLKALAGV